MSTRVVAHYQPWEMAGQRDGVGGAIARAGAQVAGGRSFVTCEENGRRTCAQVDHRICRNGLVKDDAYDRQMRLQACALA